VVDVCNHLCSLEFGTYMLNVRVTQNWFVVQVFLIGGCGIDRGGGSVGHGIAGLLG